MGETKREKRQLVEDFQIFADSVLDLQGEWFGAAENCSKPQETAGNRRKSQDAVSTPFSHLVSPIKRCPNLLILEFSQGVHKGVSILSVPWSLRPQNRAAAATCGRGRCELPVRECPSTITIMNRTSR